MSKSTFRAGLRSFLGNPDNHNTLEILEDSNGLILVIQEENSTGKMRSQGVRIEKSSGDSRQAETYQLFLELINHVHQMHDREPKHPTYIVTK